MKRWVEVKLIVLKRSEVVGPIRGWRRRKEEAMIRSLCLKVVVYWYGMEDMWTAVVVVEV